MKFKLNRYERTLLSDFFQDIFGNPIGVPYYKRNARRQFPWWRADQPDGQQSEKEEHQDKVVDPLAGVRAKIDRGRHLLTARQLQVLMVFIKNVGYQRRGELPGRSAMEHTAQELGIDHGTIKDHIIRAASNILGVPIKEILGRAAIVQTKTIPRRR